MWVNITGRLLAAQDAVCRHQDVQYATYLQMYFHTVWHTCMLTRKVSESFKVCTLSLISSITDDFACLRWLSSRGKPLQYKAPIHGSKCGGIVEHAGVFVWGCLKSEYRNEAVLACTISWFGDVKLQFCVRCIFPGQDREFVEAISWQAHISSGFRLHVVCLQ